MTEKVKKNYTRAYVMEEGCTIYRHNKTVELGNKESKAESIFKDAHTYDVYLEKNMFDAYCYTDLCNLLRYAENTDNFNMYLTGNGGETSGMMAIIAAIDDSPSRVMMQVIDACYSAHAILALCGDGIAFRMGAFLMFHNYSATIRGKGDELISQVKAVDRSLKACARNLQMPFLTAEECDRIDNDKDVYIYWDDGKELLKRCTRHYGKRA